MQVKISRDILLWYVLPIALFFIIVLVFFYQPFNASKFQIERTETPLQPNTPLQLRAGEQYEYSYLVLGMPANATYSVLGGSGGGCIRVRGIMVSNSTTVEQEACLHPSNGSPATAAEGFDFFQPWMLALRAGLRWNSTTRITYPPPLSMEESTTTSFYVEDTENMFGRAAFRIFATTSQTTQNKTEKLFTSTYWVDEEKRVLLLLNSSILSARIVSAPFNLTTAD